MKHTLMMVALVFATACVSPEAHRKVVGANEALRAEIAGMAESQKALSAENARLRSENERLASNAVDANWVKEQKARLADLLAKNPNLSGKGVNLVQTKEGPAIRVDGSVLFAPGRNDLSSEGKRTLDTLTSSLQSERIRVEGHTDTTPIRNSQWGTNLRLSVERAMAVADYLIKTSGIPKEKVSVAGYGEFLPAVPGTDDAALAANRRVEILLIDR
ncbi:MAG: OmpA family protein [Planctomycetes bacterium]|nr:OmpA family protein [Planctomycetota bacterium]MCB9885056.1 OmpA family protein [Planctomycetota bacterium]